jgi:hypothetical protein
MAIFAPCRAVAGQRISGLKQISPYLEAARSLGVIIYTLADEVSSAGVFGVLE